MATSLARNVGNLGNVLSTSGKYATQATPPVLDSSINLATTAFVKASGRTFASIFSYSSSTALSTAQTGALVQNTTGGIILTLPPIGTCPPGTVLSFLNPLNTGSVTIKGNSTELIVSPFSQTGANTIVLYPHETFDVVSTSTTWTIVGYSQLNAPVFAAPSATVQPGHFDSSNLLPNTAWMAVRGVAFNNQTTMVSAASLTLTQTHIGGCFYFNSGAVQSVVMPSPTGLPAGSQVTLISAGGTTLNVSGTNLDLGNGVFSSFSMPGSNTVTFVNNGSNVWIAVGVYPFNRNYISSTVNNLNASISNEATNRFNADNNLQNNINIEANTRYNADNSLQTQINTNDSNRINGDNNLQNQINGIRSSGGVGSYALIQRSNWHGTFGQGQTGTWDYGPGSWQYTSTTQVSGDDFGIAYRYA